jgi:hypothetical protein
MDHASRITHHASRITDHTSRITHHASRFTFHASRPVVVLLLLSFVLGACRPAAVEGSPTPEPNTVLTAAAETAEARLTENARPPDTPTPAPTDTPSPVTPTRRPTSTATLILQPSITPTAGTPTGGDAAQYVADITVPDGTQFSPGERFTKTWRLQNTGTSVWTTNYDLAFLGGAQMGGPQAVPLTQSVASGETVDISVDLVAPQETGNYKGFWEMRNAGDEFFPNAVFVDINVVGGTPAAEATSTPSGETPSGEARVSNVSLRVDDSSPNECPYTFTFTASFRLNETSAVTYLLEAGSDTPGFEFSLPGPVTGQFGAGDHSVVYNVEVTSTVEGWARLHIFSPNDVHSDQVNFSLDCSQ